jgi:hypothetical protein
MSISNLVTDWQFALLAYGLTGLALATLHSEGRRALLRGDKTLPQFVRGQKLHVGFKYDTENLNWWMWFEAYTRVAFHLVKIIVGWPVVLLWYLQDLRRRSQFLEELSVRSRQQEFEAYASELPPQECRESIDALWRHRIPENRQDDLPRFIHFRHTVEAFDEAIGRRNVLGTLAFDGSAYRGDFTIVRWSHTHGLPSKIHETIFPVQVAESHVRKLMDALRPVRLLREVPPSRYRKVRFWRMRFHLVRRLAVSAPYGCSPCLFEVESDEFDQAKASWDCVSYRGWAIDAQNARRNNKAWLTEDGVEEAYEALVDAMEIRPHLSRMPFGLRAAFTKSLG